MIVGVRRIMPPAKHSRKAQRPRTRTLTSVRRLPQRPGRQASASDSDSDSAAALGPAQPRFSTAAADRNAQTPLRARGALNSRCG